MSTATSDIIFLLEEIVPCWYEIFFDAKGPAIIVKLHRDFLRHLPKFKDSPIVRGFMDDFHFSTFEHDLANGDFGFNGSFKRIQEKDEFIHFKVEIPVFEMDVLEPCAKCDGAGRNLFGVCLACKKTGRQIKLIQCSACYDGQIFQKENCHRCEGSGKEVEKISNLDALYATSATFTLFFQLMWFGVSRKNILNTRLSQLIFIETFTMKQMHGCPISGDYSVPLVRWLAKFPACTNMPEMVGAMKATYRKIFGRDESDIVMSDIRAQVAYKGGWLNVSCPGSACGLHPALSSDIAAGRGYRFDCHNLDTPMQQLTLLAGLAALCDRARKEGV